MRRIDEQRGARVAKKILLEQHGINPFPARSSRTHMCNDVRETFVHLEKNHKRIAIAGRIVALRPQGGTTFLMLDDESGTLQCMVRRDEIGADTYTLAVKTLDLGDILEIGGTAMTTRKGEKTILASDVRMLAKSLRPLPEQHSGLKDVETRLRKRYLDLLMNHETRELFKSKAKFWATLRSIMSHRGFLEVETPILESVPGGAEAEPFLSYHHALDQDVNLRISLELPLKRLLVGGFEKVFEIGRIFRNEGISSEHLQDYTQLEFYWAYADYHDLMTFLPKLYMQAIASFTDPRSVMHEGVVVDWSAPWEIYDYYECFQKSTGIDLRDADTATLLTKAKEFRCAVEPYAQKGRVIDAIFKKTVRPTLIKPGLLLDPPVEIEPLAKRTEKDPERVERLQVVAWGSELGKGFSELNDPIDQRRRFEQQMQLRASGDREAQTLDEDYLEALEYGMPPAAGFGLSERLFAYCVDRPVREAVLFPLLKNEKATVKKHHA